MFAKHDVRTTAGWPEFKRIIKRIVVIAVLMVASALAYLHQQSLDANTVIAMTLELFFSVPLGCGLFAAAFFNCKSGEDQNVTNATS